MLLVLLLSACSDSRSVSEPVTPGQMTALQVELKSRYVRDFRPMPGVDFSGCAARRLGAARAGNRTVVYLYRLCATWPARCAVDTDESAGEAGPAVVYLHGIEVERVQLVGDGNRYGRDVNAWFPDRLREAAAFPGNAVVDALEKTAREDAGCTR